MNQIMYKDEQEIKRNKKKSKLFKAMILVLVGVVLLIGSYSVYNKIIQNNNIFIPEETKLNLYIHENNVIIEAYNSQGLVELKHKWDEEDSYTVYPSNENNASINVNIPILKGEHILYVEVLDSNGNQLIKNQKIKGVTEAKIYIKVIDGYFEINVTDDEKIESIEYEFNNMNYNVDSGGIQEFVFMQKMDYGKNNIKVMVKNSQGVYTTKEMEYEY